MTDEKKPKPDRQAARKAFIERRNGGMEEKRKALQAAFRALKEERKKPKFKGRIREDLTTDLEKLNDLSKKPERDITGRRGKNLFRAYPWIGGR